MAARHSNTIFNSMMQSIYIKRHLYSIVCNTNKTLFHNTIHHAPCTPTKPAPCTKGQPIKSDLTAPLLTLANYLYTYIIRLLPPSSAPGYFVSLSPIGPICPGVNPNSNPNPLLKTALKMPIGKTKSKTTLVRKNHISQTTPNPSKQQTEQNDTSSRP